MNRRETVLALLALGSAPLRSYAQQPRKVWRVGFLGLSGKADTEPVLDSFKQGLLELGYTEGRDYVLEPRFSDNKPDRLQGLAAELVRLKVDVIAAWAGSGARAAQKETATIPIVMLSVGDPVGSGLVKSLARPGGNITGTSNTLTDVAPKHLDLMRDTIPGVTRLAVMMNPSYQTHRDALRSVEGPAPRVGIRILPIEAGTTKDIESGFASMAKQNAQALIVVPDPIFYGHRRQIAALAVRGRLASVGHSSEYADAGFLIGYGPNRSDIYRRAAVYVDKIFKGAKPADLPVEQPTKFELVVNLKTAKALGMTIPQSILFRADRVIE